MDPPKDQHRRRRGRNLAQLAVFLVARQDGVDPTTRDEGWHGLPCSVVLTLPPLAVLWLVPAQEPEQPEGPNATNALDE